MSNQFIVSSSVLASRLNSIKSVIASNPILPILSNFLFELEADHLKVSASDLSIFLSTEALVETRTEDFSCCVPAKLLTDLLAKLPEQPITLVFSDELDVLVIRSYSGTYEIPLENAVDWPQSTEATPGIKFDLPVDQLSHALIHTAFATSTDELRPHMTCVFIESNLGLRFAATDGHRVVRVERPNAGIEPCKALLPRKAATLLIKLLTDAHGDVSIEVTPTTINFILSSHTLQTRQVEGEFPNIDTAFDWNPYILECDKSPVINALKTALLFANKTTAQVRVDLQEPEHFVISAESIDWNRRAKEVIENAQYSGDDLSVGFNGKLLLELLEHIDGPLVELSFISPLKGVILREKAVDSDEVTVTSLIMPMMISEELAPTDFGKISKDLNKQVDDAFFGKFATYPSEIKATNDSVLRDQMKAIADEFGASEVTVSGTDASGNETSITVKGTEPKNESSEGTKKSPKPKNITFRKHNGDPVDA